MVAYHDDEWGRLSRDDTRLFEMLILEGAQAGLSWQTILRKRDGYRRAFAGFDPEVVARFTEADEASLLADPGIIRNRAKIKAAIGNAQAALRLRDEFGSLHAYFVSMVPQPPTRLTKTAEPGTIPITTPISATRPPLKTIDRRTRWAGSPSAMRTAISRVRRVTS